jgi:hypothetical protein
MKTYMPLQPEVIELPVRPKLQADPRYYAIQTMTVLCVAAVYALPLTRGAIEAFVQFSQEIMLRPFGPTAALTEVAFMNPEQLLHLILTDCLRLLVIAATRAYWIAPVIFGLSAIHERYSDRRQQLDRQWTDHAMTLVLAAFEKMRSTRFIIEHVTSVAYSFGWESSGVIRRGESPPAIFWADAIKKLVPGPLPMHFTDPRHHGIDPQRYKPGQPILMELDWGNCVSQRQD